jgi:hypothetical protein
MQFTNVDMMARRYLLERGLPIHWYAEVLFHCTSAIRELCKSTPIVPENTRKLPVDANGSADLPEDFMDDIVVCLPTGGKLKPLVSTSNLNPLRSHDSTGAFLPTSTASTDSDLSFGAASSGTWFWNVNDYGEATGRYFGASGSSDSNTYQIIPQDRRIQMNNFSGDSIILKYITNGQSLDNATQVDWGAHQVILAYVDWKTSPNRSFKDSPEASTFYNERRLFVAYKDDVTIEKVKDILKRNYRATK